RPGVLGQVEAIDIEPTSALVTAAGEVGGAAIGTDDQAMIVLRGIDRVADVPGAAPLPLVVHAAVEDIIAADSTVPLSRLLAALCILRRACGEVHGMAVAVQEGRLLITICVDRSWDGHGRPPLPLVIACALVDVDCAATSAHRCEVERAAIGAQG